VAVRRVVVAEDIEHPFDRDAFRVHRDQDHGLLPVRWRRQVGLAMKIAIMHRGSPAPDVHHLRPLITYSSPSRAIED